MGSIALPMLKEAGVASGQFCTLNYHFTVNSNAATLLPSGDNQSRILLGYAASSTLTTTAIDAFTGLTGDIVGNTAFGSTAMGTDAMGFVVDMQGQVATAVALQAILFESTFVGVGVAGTSTALTDALSTAFCVSPLGNIYGRTVLTGFDAASSKHMWLRLVVKLK